MFDDEDYYALGYKAGENRKNIKGYKKLGLKDEAKQDWLNGWRDARSQRLNAENDRQLERVAA